MAFSAGSCALTFDQGTGKFTGDRRAGGVSDWHLHKKDKDIDPRMNSKGSIVRLSYERKSDQLYLYDIFEVDFCQLNIWPPGNGHAIHTLK